MQNWMKENKLYKERMNNIFQGAPYRTTKIPVFTGISCRFLIPAVESSFALQTGQSFKQVQDKKASLLITSQ